MDQYLELVEDVLKNGNYKPNRTDVDTISKFGYFYKIDWSEGFPLLTTKDLSGYRWNSLIHELLWYFSGEEHIKTLEMKPRSGMPGQMNKAYLRLLMDVSGDVFQYQNKKISYQEKHFQMKTTDGSTKKKTED